MTLEKPMIDQLPLHQHQYAEKISYEYSAFKSNFYVKLPLENCNQSKVLTSSQDILECPCFDYEWQWSLWELHKLHILNEKKNVISRTFCVH